MGWPVTFTLVMGDARIEETQADFGSGTETRWIVRWEPEGGAGAFSVLDSLDAAKRYVQRLADEAEIGRCEYCGDAEFVTASFGDEPRRQRVCMVCKGDLEHAEEMDRREMAREAAADCKLQEWKERRRAV